jgi:poly-gamma-glutamate capsule biosynthesis protein CapA/YwtB (metallophosphatase superfamily)
MAACTIGAGEVQTTSTTAGWTAPLEPLVQRVARLAFVGDLMLGRNVSPVVESDPGSVFERLRPALVAADLAFGNLESPLTTRPHIAGPHALEAEPSAATLLAGAGFDVLDVANNHASDAGPDTVVDTIRALHAAGLHAVGGGATASAAEAPVVLDANGVTVGVLVFDASGGAAATSTSPGVSTWDTASAYDAVTELRQEVDVVVVGLHGGVEYLKRPDPTLAHLVDMIAGWGVDIIWGHGAHAAYPVEFGADPTRASVVAPGLGNALFDQRLPGTQVGGLLEVLVDADGVIAVRTGTITIDAGRSAFEGWDVPSGDAVALDGGWWSLVRPWTAATLPPSSTSAREMLPDGFDVVAAAVGDVTGSGVADTVISYRRPAIDHAVHERFPGVEWVDETGRSAHIAVYRPDGSMRWGSAFLFQPIADVAVCTGAIAIAFSTFGDQAVVAGGAWTWDRFGFVTAPPLAGHATPACADIDHDSRLDAVLADLSDNQEGAVP